jgi:aminopeptidase N
MRLLRAAIVLLFLAVWGRADNYPRQPLIDVIHYDISLELTDASDSIAGTTRVHVRIKEEGASSMWLDFSDMKVDKLLVQGAEKHFTHGNGRLAFEFGRACTRNEVVVVEVRYHGRAGRGLLIRNNSYGRRVFSTDSWPDRARHWFPSIDHPSDKATADITVTAPVKYDVVSNGRLMKTVSLRDGRKLTRWSQGRPIPTCCMAFGAAEFSIDHRPAAAGIPVDWYFYEPDAAAAALKFGRTDVALSYFDRLIGPYPYEKLAQVQATIDTGAMENASAIFYAEAYLQKPPISEQPVPHEIAHQWFGNSVTQADWDHIWLSEGFATYLEALFYEHLEGPEALKQAMIRSAMRINKYQFTPSTPIVDPAEKDLFRKLNPLTYDKGAWVLHMLRGIMGDERFFAGIRRYYELYQDRNAVTEDFQKVMEDANGTDLSVFFRQWLYRPGMPKYHVSWRWNAAAGEADITLRQEQSAGLFDMPLEIAFLVEGGRETRKCRVFEAVHTFRIPLAAEPLSIEIDPDGWVLKSLSGND